MSPVRQRARTPSLVSIPWNELHRYLHLAAISACVTLGLPVVLHEFALVEEKLSVGLSLLTAFFLNFLLARSYVFRTRTSLAPQLFRFAFANLTFRLSEYLAFLAIYHWLELFYALAVAIVLFLSFIIKFVLYRLFVFKSPESGNLH